MKRNIAVYCTSIMKGLYESMLNYRQTVADICTKYRKDIEASEKAAKAKYPLSIEAENAVSHFDPVQRREREERIKAESTVVEKYRATYVDAKREVLMPEARQKIREAQNIFHEEAGKVARDLREHLEKSMHDPLNSAFMQHARILNEFSISPTEFDFESLLANGEDHPMSYRIIDAIIKKTDAAYTLRWRPLESYDKDVKMIESLATDECFAVPVDHLHEVVELFEGVPIYQEQADTLEGKIKTGFNAKYDLTMLSAHYGLFEGNLERLGKICGAIEEPEGTNATWFDEPKIEVDFAKKLAKEKSGNSASTKEAMNHLQDAGYVK